MTVRQALAEGSALLATAGIESPALDASLLLAEACGVNRSALAAAGVDPLPDADRAVFRRLLERRLAGECIAYITGRKEFYGLEFAVNHCVLVPRPDTETLVEAALSELKIFVNTHTINSLRALDLCTGSGAVAIALKHELPELEMRAADISSAALAAACANAAGLLPGLASEPVQNPALRRCKHHCGVRHTATLQAQKEPENRDFCGLLTTKNTILNRLSGGGIPIRFFESDLFDALDPSLLFDIITANPPYIPSAEIKNLAPEVRREPLLALDGGDDGLDLIRRIAAEAPAHLRSGGVLLMEADPRQMKTIAALLEAAGFTGIKVIPDISGRERVISGSR